MQLNGGWQWYTEYALSSNNLNIHLGDPGRRFGRTFRTTLQGTWQKINLNIALRDVTPNFASPANTGMSQFSRSDRRGVDVAGAGAAALQHVLVRGQPELQARQAARLAALHAAHSVSVDDGEADETGGISA